MSVGSKTLCHIIVNGRCLEAVWWVEWNDDFTAHGLLWGCCDGMMAHLCYVWAHMGATGASLTRNVIKFWRVLTKSGGKSSLPIAICFQVDCDCGGNNEFLAGRDKIRREIVATYRHLLPGWSAKSSKNDTCQRMMPVRCAVKVTVGYRQEWAMHCCQFLTVTLACEGRNL